MKRNSLIVLCLLPLLGSAHLRAQQAPDSVIVMGTVVNQLSGRPEPFSVVRLLQDTVVMATAPCDEEGWFGIRALPAGRYLLEVQTRGLTLYQADLVLQENASLNIGVITDSLRLVNLNEVKVVALRHLLGPLQIASKKDFRLWDFSSRSGDFPRDGNAAVCAPAALHPLFGDGPCEGSGDCSRCKPSKHFVKYYMQSYGLNVSPDNSAMKNELLRDGRIRDVKYPAPADSAKSR